MLSPVNAVVSGSSADHQRAGEGRTLIDFGRGLCCDLRSAERREWLVTNGIGGYASGTVGGLLTRRYHGLLVAALKPPLGRTLLVSKLEETLTYGGNTCCLAANHWVGGAVAPTGYVYLDRFHLEGATPVWTYACADALLERRIWMAHGQNTTYVRYDLQRGNAPVSLQLNALVNYRDHHAITRADGWQMQVEPVEHGLRVRAFDAATPFFLLSPEAQVTPKHAWYLDVYLGMEAYRGMESVEDHLLAGTFEAVLQPGEHLTIVASTEAAPGLNGTSALQEHRERERNLIVQAGFDEAPGEIRQLALAADQFIVRRAAPEGRQGHTILAGYPWFGDWGRDAMIALPGLTLCTGRPDVAADVLRTFAQFVSQGMLPNRFPNTGEEPSYNTVDAALWYIEALRAYHAATNDLRLLQEVFPSLEEIIDRYQHGTRHNIHVDPADGLLYAGEAGVQLTWMDAKVGDRVITPRVGKPVEVNALWYNALRSMAAFARLLGEDAAPFSSAADRAEEGFGRFWNEEAGFCYDVLDAPEGHDAALRPNQLFAAALPYSPLTPERQKAVVDVCARRLLTAYGLRSLAPGDPAYAGRYGGDQASRDGTYHQGTVWSWLIGPFVAAHLKVYSDKRAARSYLYGLLRHLSEHGLGTISEIFDGDVPFAPRGAFAQAWSVAEVLRAWHLTA